MPDPSKYDSENEWMAVCVPQLMKEGKDLWRNKKDVDGELFAFVPLNKGIHQTGAAGDALTLSLGVYGRSLRQGLHFFNRAARKITRARTRVLFRKVLALRALTSVGEAVGQTYLTSSLLDLLPEDLIREFQQFSSNSNRQ